MRRDIDLADELARGEIDDPDGVPGMRVVAVNPISVHGDVRKLVIGGDRELVRLEARLFGRS